MSRPVGIAIFASGQGSLFEYLVQNQKEGNFEVVALVYSSLSAPVVNRSKELIVPAIAFPKNEDVTNFLKILVDMEVRYIVLAGFLKKIPIDILKVYENRIINTHPSLLPKFGGKGMWGINVHKAVLSANEIETGCTTHFVNENYDEGEIIRQLKTKITSEDTAETLQEKVKQLEKENLFQTLKEIISK